MLEFIEQSQVAVDEFIDVVGRALGRQSRHQGRLACSRAMPGWPPAWPRCTIYLAQYPEVTWPCLLGCGNGGLDWARVKAMIEGPGEPLQQDSRVCSPILNIPHLPHNKGIMRPGSGLNPK